MLNYQDYIFELRLEKAFSNLSEMKYTSDNTVVWDHVKELIPENEKDFWNKIQTLPKWVKNLLSNLLSKSFSLLNNITAVQTNKLLNKLLESVNRLVKEPALKKKLFYLIVFFVITTTGLSISGIDVSQDFEEDVTTVVNEIKPKIVHKLDVETPNIITPKTTQKSYQSFLTKLAFKESSNKWDTVRYVVKKKHRKSGKRTPVYVGKYQFGNLAFRDIKSNVRVKDFAENPNIWTEAQQDIDILKLLKNNKHYLRHKSLFKGYEHYIGQTINGVKITESGVLAASHLVGYKNVKKFLSSNGEKDPADGNGTKCSAYMTLFAGYNLPV